MHRELKIGTRNKEQRAKTIYYRLALRRQDIFVFCLLSFVFVLYSCKSQRTLAPFVLRDSISITYKQGQTLTPTLSLIGQGGMEQPTPTGVRGAAIESRKNSSVPADGSVGLGATREASVFEGLLSQRTNKSAVPMIRVDTVFVERWHTTEVPSPPKPIPRFYKDCTWGFFILVLLILGRIALRITKAVCLRR